MLADFKGGLILNGLATLDAATAGILARSTEESLYLCGITTLDAHAAEALSKFKGEDLFLEGLAALDADTAKALAEFRGTVMLHGLERASFGAVRVLRNRPNVEMPNPWYLLREQIAALVGTEVFVIMAGVVV